MDVKELTNAIRHLVASGNKLSSSTGCLLHGNLRSLNHFVNGVDDDLIEWARLIVTIETLLQRIENEEVDGDINRANSNSSCNCCSDNTSESSTKVCQGSCSKPSLINETVEDGTICREAEEIPEVVDGCNVSYGRSPRISYRHPKHSFKATDEC